MSQPRPPSANSHGKPHGRPGQAGQALRKNSAPIRASPGLPRRSEHQSGGAGFQTREKALSRNDEGFSPRGYATQPFVIPSEAEGPTFTKG